MKKQIFTFLVAGTVALYSCEDKKTETSENTTTESTSDTTATTDGTTPDTSTVQSFKIDTAHSVVKWTGKKVTGKHNGSIKIQGGEIQTKGKSITGGNIVLNMNSITNEDISDKEDNKKLIGHLRSPDFFSVDKYPTATFEVKRIDAGEKDNETIVTGDLTLKGKKEEISIPVKLDVNDEKLTAKGTTTIDRTKWDIKYGSGKFFKGLGDKAIYDEVELEFEVEATK